MYTCKERKILREREINTSLDTKQNWYLKYKEIEVYRVRKRHRERERERE